MAELAMGFPPISILFPLFFFSSQLGVGNHTAGLWMTFRVLEVAGIEDMLSR